MKIHDKEKSAESEAGSFRVHLPGFVVEEEIGLGDIIKRVTYAFGLKSCGSCEKRAETLNRWMTFSR